MEIITLNMVPKGITPVCHASQFDDGRVIRLNIVDELHGYIFTDEDVELRVRKPDDNVVTASVAVVSGNAYVDIVTTEQMTACEGDNECELRLTKGEQRIGSLNFKMRVEKDPLKDGIESETVIHNLEQQVEDLVSEQYDADSVIFDDEPTEGHGTGYAVKSGGLKAYIPKAIDELDDVEINNPQANQAIVYNPTTQKFENGEVSTVGSIDDLDDVDTTGKGTGDSLRFDPDAGEDGEWVAQQTVVLIDEADYEDLQEKQLCTFYAIDDGSPLDYTAEDILYEEGSTDTTHEKIEDNKTAITNLRTTVTNLREWTTSTTSFTAACALIGIYSGIGAVLDNLKTAISTYADGSVNMKSDNTQVPVYFMFFGKGNNNYFTGVLYSYFYNDSSRQPILFTYNNGTYVVRRF